MYSVPDNYYFRLHHVRPKFKRNIESVLYFLSSSLSKISPTTKSDFNEQFEAMIRLFPSNQIRKSKTIKNWRSEISALFGFIVMDRDGNYKIGNNALMLAQNGNLIEFFQYFLYTFQYPGAHMKPQETKKIISNNIKFKPADFIIRLLRYAEYTEGCRFGITKAETTHCIFNDLRVTTQHEKLENTFRRIKQNRKNKVNYDVHGDIIRYAGDILDYMCHANFLIAHGYTYYLNKYARHATDFILNNYTWFSYFDNFYSHVPNDLTPIASISNSWFEYVNSFANKLTFNQPIETTSQSNFHNLYTTITNDNQKLVIPPEIIQSLKNGGSSKIIGNVGEALVHGHEYMLLKQNERDDLAKKIKIVSNVPVGYDIKSFTNDGISKCIEVKTTISTRPMIICSFHMTDNEWNVGEDMGRNYYLYRLQLIITEKEPRGKIIILQNPVKMYKDSLIGAKLNNGINITFRPDVGKEEELLLCAKK